MEKILIVGGTGFLGFHLAKYYSKKKIFKIISLSRKKPKQARKIQDVNYIYCDITKKNKLFNILKKHKNIKYVINFGGEVEHKKLKKTFSSHYIGLKNLTEFFMKKDIKKFIQIGSSLEYGNCRSPQKETNVLRPKSNYSKAKAYSSRFLINLYKRFDFPIIIIRPYQVFGPYQDLNRLIPFVINSCLNNKKFACSNGLQLRDFLYVDDFTNSITSLLRKNLKGQIFNVGLGKAIQIKKIIKLIQKKLKKGTPEFGKIKLRSDENLITYPDISKIRKMIKWKPKTSFLSGLNKTINFYKRHKI